MLNTKLGGLRVREGDGYNTILWNCFGSVRAREGKGYITLLGEGKGRGRQ